MEQQQRNTHRACIKQGSGNWKDKIREDCRRLARERRQQKLQQHRSSTSPGLAARLQEDIHAVMKKVMKGLQHTPPRGQAGATSSSGSFGSSMGDQQSGPPVPAADVDAFLAELEQQLVADMLHELELLDAYEAAELAAAVAEHEALTAAAAAGVSSPTTAAPPGAAGCSPSSASSSPGLLCPVCMRAFLLQRTGIVVCPDGCLQLNLAAESISLNDLRARLNHVYEEHMSTGCSGSLSFRMEDVFGSRSLTSTCNNAGCQMQYRIVA